MFDWRDRKIEREGNGEKVHLIMQNAVSSLYLAAFPVKPNAFTLSV